MKVQIFSNSRRGNPRMEELSNLVQLIKSDAKLKMDTDFCRTLDDPARYGREKSSDFLTCTFGCVFRDGSENFTGDNVESLTGLVTIDIDHFKSYEDACWIRDAVFDGGLRPVLAFISPSGKGVKFVFRVEGLAGGGTQDEMSKRYLRAFRRINAELYFRHNVIFHDGVILDKNNKDMTHCCFLSHDADVVFDEEMPCTTLTMDEENVDSLLNRIWGKDEDEFRSSGNRRDGDFSPSEYLDVLKNIRSTLEVDENGKYIYNMSHRVEIGHRTDGTAKVRIGEYEGYEIMYRLNAVAMWLCNGDVHEADALLERCFIDYDRYRWNKVSRSNGVEPPNYSVLRWFLDEFGFKRIFRTMFTEDCLVEAARPKRTYISDDVDFCRVYNIPVILSKCMDEASEYNQTKDIAFFSTLAMISGFAPNQRIVYGGKRRGLNLQLAVVGSQGSGKGKMTAPLEHLLPSLNRFCDECSDIECSRYDSEIRSRQNTILVGSTTNTSTPNTNVPVAPKLDFRNIIGTPNRTSVLEFLPPNNAKCVFSTEEFTTWAKIERGQYGGIIDAMKISYDNGTISNETAMNIREGRTTNVYNSNFSVLASGTPDSFNKFFRNVEDGELRRVMVFLLEDLVWDPYEIYSTIEDWSDVESQFIQWYFYNFYKEFVTEYIPDLQEYETMKDFYRKWVHEMRNTYGDNSITGEAANGLIGSVMVLVLRIAALLQSLHDFLTSIKVDFNFSLDAFNSDYNISVYDDVQGNFFTRTPEFYIDTVRKRMKKPVAKVQTRIIDSLYLEAAYHIMLPRMFDALDCIEARNSDSMIGGIVNPLKGMKCIAALGMVGDVFETSEYIAAYNKLDGKVCRSYISRQLNRLVKSGKITKTGHGIYQKK